MPARAFFGLKFGSSSDATRTAKKAELLQAIKGTKRGLSATDEQKQQIEVSVWQGSRRQRRRRCWRPTPPLHTARPQLLASQLERINPTKQPLAASDLLSGQWELLYTTSESILGSKRPAFLRPAGPIYQTIGPRGGTLLRTSTLRGACTHAEHAIATTNVLKLAAARPCAPPPLPHTHYPHSQTRPH
jgi:hypothetical protein